MSSSDLRPANECALDVVSLGEVMLRLDPGEGRVHTARSFNVWEGGGEYNVARGLRRCFELRAGIVTALVDNAIGRLVEDLMLQGGLDLTHVRWVEHDGVGRAARNGLNFTERGFGPRAALGCSDRGHTACSKLQLGDIDWDAVFDRGVRVLHTGGVFSALSETTPLVAQTAMEAARRFGALVSYDLNYRPSLWKDRGGREASQRVNRNLVPLVDVLFGNEEDFSSALGFELPGVGDDFDDLPTSAFRSMIEKVVHAYPNLRTVATTLRTARTASINGWGAICYHDGSFYEVPQRDIEILDRVGGGDSFASGFLYGLLQGESPRRALEIGVAHGALAMSTPGDTTMARLPEVLRFLDTASARVDR